MTTNTHSGLVVTAPATSRKRINIVFHGPCSDGFGAAWSFYQSMLLKPPQTPVEVAFIMDRAGNTPKTHELLSRSSLSKETTYFLDICPKRELLQKFKSICENTQVLDHHKTAFEDCGDLPYCFFDMNRSGAGIAWDKFVQTPRPKLIDCVEAGDLWRWDSVEYASEICTALELVGFKFEGWDLFNHELINKPEQVITRGKHYSEYRRAVSGRLIGGKVHKLTVGDLTMPAVNASIMQSGIGNALTRKPGPCGAVYYTRGNGWMFSLRSSDAGPDVSKIAARYGGGGHRNASGFKIESLTDLNYKGIYFSNYTETEEAEIIESINKETDLICTLDTFDDCIKTFGG